MSEENFSTNQPVLEPQPVLEQQEPKKHNMVLIVIIVAIVAITAGVIGYLFAKKTQTPTGQPTNQSQQTTQQQVQIAETQELAQTAVPSSQVPKNYADENISWYTQPKEVTDIKLFKGDNTPAYKVWETGKVKNGAYVGSRILLAIVEPSATYYHGIYRFVQKNGEQELALLKEYSSSDIYTDFKLASEDGRLNQKTLPYKSYTYEIKISSLDYPGIISGASGQLITKETDYPFAGVYEDGKLTDKYWTGGFFDTSLLKFSFSDPIYGNVYMTDLNKKTEENKGSIYMQNGFYIKAPDGTFKVYSAVIDLGGDVPNITWNDGTQNKSAYMYQAESGCGSSGYADVVTDLTEADFVEAGKAGNGDVVYKLADKNHKMLTDYYAADLKLAKGNGPEFEGKKFNAGMSYEDFLDLHPMFFWKDSFGRWIRVKNKEVIPSGGGCGKPVIYLYPEQTQNVSVKVTPTAGMTVSEPAYNGGWNVVADPESNIRNLADNKTYPYLFWEGSGKDIYTMPQRGFVTAKENLNSFFNEKLAQSGLIQKEINDFKEFWIPKMLETNKPYYFVTFVDRATIDKLAPLDINPKPDTTIRVLMDYKGLDNPMNVREFNIETPKRLGFTAVEWGGVLK